MIKSAATTSIVKTGKSGLAPLKSVAVSVGVTGAVSWEFSVGNTGLPLKSKTAKAGMLGAEIKEAPSIPTEYDEHEVQFLEVLTSKGGFTMASHNEHNGYYGGFLIRAAVES